MSSGLRFCLSTSWVLSSGPRSISITRLLTQPPRHPSRLRRRWISCVVPAVAFGNSGKVMLQAISNLIGTQPILALFLAVGLGYAVGQISILGFSLGIGAVLFVGLFLGAVAPQAHIAGPIGLIGLIMFLYGIGILYGRQFFDGLTGVGQKYNLLAAVAVLAGLSITLALGHVFKLEV